MNTKTALLATAFLALTLGSSASAQSSTETQGRRPPAPEARHPRLRERTARRGELHRFIRSLGLSDSQRAVALEEAKAAEPIARSARTEAMKIRTEARRTHPDDRAAAREDARPKLKDLRERTLASLRPLAQRMLSTLTPEQRARITESAKKRGRTIDENRLEDITSWLLTRPRTVQRLERHVQR
jgi:hypothetical protein